ncbi:hypothetical protein [Streptomyces sp. NPDC005799]|uniref:hypothetical protein n=1 Tax=Streptomyces sp. NPDC005799 TaxID=3154678 RepID=UPI0033D2D686
MKRALSAKVLTMAAIVGATILSTSSAAVAAGLPSQANVTGTGQVTNSYANGGRYIPYDVLIDAASETAEYVAARQCDSGEIRTKHLKWISGPGYVDDPSSKTQIATVQISTTCW